MKRFCQLILSLLIPIIVLGSVVSLRESFEWRKVLADKPNIVILGDSHAQPLSLAKSVTLAHGGDPFLMPLLHIQRLQKTPNFKDVKTFILTVGPHNFGPLYNNRLLKNHKDWLGSNAARIANALRWFDYGKTAYPYLPRRQIFKQEFLLFNKTLSTSVKIWNDTPQLDSARTARALKRHRVLEEGWFQKDGIQRDIFQEIIELTKQENAQLIIVGTPLHFDYHRQVEQLGMNEYFHFLDSVTATYKHVSYLSYELEPWPDSLFKDCDHINHSGSNKLKKMLSSEIIQFNNALQLP